MRFELYSGAGNRFLLTCEDRAGRVWADVAREACSRSTFDDQPADGLLVVEGAHDGRARMLIFNADGSRPEACGNGLRCVAWHLERTGHGQVLRISTDAGERRVQVVRREEARAQLLAQMGEARELALRAPLPVIQGLRSARHLNVGNPHCVLQVEDERIADVERIGRILQTHPDFSEGVNVGFLAVRDAGWYLRVWERGVGETEACGSGACAAAMTMTAPGEEVVIHMRGGPLRVRRDAGLGVELYGEAFHHGHCDLQLESARATTH